VKNSPNIWFDRKFLSSEAFLSLSRIALLVLFFFLGKRETPELRTRHGKEYPIRNNGEIVFSYLEAEKKGISRAQFRDAIDQLIEYGFLSIAHHGWGGRKGDMTKYSLDTRWKNYGTPSFQEVKPREKNTQKWKGWAKANALGVGYQKSSRTKKKVQSSVLKITPKKERLGIKNHTPNQAGKGVSSVESHTQENSEVAVSA